MNIFDSLTRWITHPMHQQRIDLAALNIDQLVDINNYEIKNSDSTIKEFINYQLVLLYLIIVRREATRGQLDFNYYETG